MKDTGDGARRVTQISPLAGVTAGTAAVLFAFGVLALAWQRVAGQVSMAVAVLAYAVMAAVAVTAAAGAAYAFLWVRHRARNPELLTGRRQAVQAEVMAAQPAAPDAIPYAQPAAAIEPPRVYLNVTPDQLAAIVRHNAPGTAGTAGDAITEGN